VIVGIIRRKPVLTHASIVCEGMLASVNLMNSAKFAMQLTASVLLLAKFHFDLYIQLPLQGEI